jgi:hypothetical protein
MFYDRDRSDRLRLKYPTIMNGGEWRPYEYDPRYTDEQIPWRVAGFKDADPIRESKEQQEHDTHAVGAFGP